MKKIIKEESIYTPGQVTLVLSFAEWQAIRGFASTITTNGSTGVSATRARYAATRLASGSKYYNDLDLDWSKLFHEDP